MAKGHVNGQRLQVPPGTRLINPQEQPKLASLGGDPRRFEADFQPTGDQVLLRVLEQKTTAGGLALPDGAATNEPKRAQIVKCGPGRFHEILGRIVPLKEIDERFAEGRVIYPMMGGGGAHVFQVGDEKYILVAAAAIMGFSSAPPQSLPEAVA